MAGVTCLGEACGWADITSYFPIWMARTFVPAAEQLLASHARTHAWEARMRAIGHGVRQDIEAATALEIACNATPDPGRGVDAADPLGLGRAIG